MEVIEGLAEQGTIETGGAGPGWGPADPGPDGADPRLDGADPRLDGADPGWCSADPGPDDVRDPVAALTGALDLVGRVRERCRDSTAPVDDPELEARLRATEAARRAIDAMELTLVAELNRHGERRGSDGIHREVRLAVDQVAQMAPDALALTVGIGPSEADKRCRLAARAATDLADVAELMAAGRVSRRAMEQLDKHTRDTDSDTTRAIVDHLLGARRGEPGSIRICGMEPHEVAKTCRRLISRLDPELMQARAEANRATRLDVRTDPGPIGTSCLTATLPTEMGAAIQAAVDQAGALRRKDDPTMPVGRARALGLADLVLCGVELEAQVRLGIPVLASAASRLTFAPDRQECGGCHEALADPLVGLPEDGTTYGQATTESVRIVTGSGADAVDVLTEEWFPDVTTEVRLGAARGAPGDGAQQDRWVSGTTIPGVGYVPPDAVAAILGRLDVRIGRALLDARTGTLLETSTDRYAIPKAQREFVATRDGTCRMWGCERPVHSTRLGWQADVDHATPWPAGETTPGNLSALCRHHHLVKHSARWTHRLNGDGSTEWVTPGGTVAFTFPVHAVDADDVTEGGAVEETKASSPPTGTNEAHQPPSSPPTGTNEPEPTPVSAADEIRSGIRLPSSPWAGTNGLVRFIGPFPF